jgi:hypothetical protein
LSVDLCRSLAHSLKTKVTGRRGVVPCDAPNTAPIISHENANPAFLICNLDFDCLGLRVSDCIREAFAGDGVNVLSANWLKRQRRSLDGQGVIGELR